MPKHHGNGCRDQDGFFLSFAVVILYVYTLQFLYKVADECCVLKNISIHLSRDRVLNLDR